MARDSRHRPGQHREGVFRIPHPTADQRGSLYQPRKKSIVGKIIEKIKGQR